MIPLPNIDRAKRIARKSLIIAPYVLFAAFVLAIALAILAPTETHIGEWPGGNWSFYKYQNRNDMDGITYDVTILPFGTCFFTHWGLSKTNHTENLSVWCFK